MLTPIESEKWMSEGRHYYQNRRCKSISSHLRLWNWKPFWSCKLAAAICTAAYIYIGHTPAPYAARRERAIDRRTHHMHARCSSEWFVPATIISKYGKFSPWGSALELLNVSTYPKEIFGGSMPFVLLMHGGHVGIHVTVVIVFYVLEL